MVSFTSALFALAVARSASASLYVTFPIKGSTCAVGQNCQIKWTDSQDAPSTSTLGETSVDLVTGDAGNLQLAQALGGVSNPSSATALTFTPQASLSPTAQYAIRFTPKKNTSALVFSTYFTITGGTGTASNSSTKGANSTAASGAAASNSSSVSSSMPSMILITALGSLVSYLVL